MSAAVVQEHAISWVEYASALGSIATALALIVAVFGLYQNTVARNLQTVSDFARKLSDLRQNAFETGVYGKEYMDDPARVHAYQMLDFIEHVCFLVNKRHVTGNAASFLNEWLRFEIPHIYEQPIFEARIKDAADGELSELKAMHFKFTNESVERKITGG